MKRKMRIPKSLQPPVVLYGSVIREFRVKVGISQHEVAAHIRLHSANRYDRAIESPPLGKRAVEVKAGYWWNQQNHERAQRVVQYLWDRADNEQRQWLRDLVR